MKVVFTSCMDAERAPDQPVWLEIQKEKPDVLMLLGDQIYMDWGLSLAKVPHWKKAIDKKGAQGLELFGREMHRRYAMQWAVPQFRELITWFMARNAATPERMVMTWDEHDFAWNNAYGEGDDPRSVPDDVKQLARRLFFQFRGVLRNPAANTVYPAYPPPESPQPEALGIRPDAFDIAAHDLRVVTLDERYFRTQRDEGGAHLLGAAQLGWLATQLGSKALTIVAGSSPLEHAYLLGHQGWTAPPQPGQTTPRAYPDLQAFADAASASGKPVLYLAGDIHRNAWGGRLGNSPIVHAVSSGAALGNIALRRFDPCYGVVTLETPPGAAAGERTARVVLKRLDHRNGFAPLPADRDFLLRYNAQGWQGEVPAGDSVKPERFDGDSELDEHLTVFVTRQRSAPFVHVPGRFAPDPKVLEGIFGDALPATAEAWPDVVELTPSGAGRYTATVERCVNTLMQDDSAPVVKAVQEAFERAAHQGKKTVVLYVHGFGKGFGDSIGQAMALRNRFPQAEVMLFSWGTGSDENLWKTIGSATKAQADADTPRVYGKLAGVMKAFNDAAGNPAVNPTGMKAVLVARSLGCTLLRAVLLRGEPTPNIARMVLSAAAAAKNNHAQWLGATGTQACVTINREDSKLKLLDWLKFGSHPLGLFGPVDEDLAPKTLYFDCTGVPGVALDHDYLFRHLNADLDELNRRMIMGDSLAEPIAGFAATTPAVPSGSRVFAAT